MIFIIGIINDNDVVDIRSCRLDWANRGNNSTEAFNDHYGARVGDR